METKQHSDALLMTLMDFETRSDGGVKSTARRRHLVERDLVDSLYQYLDFKVLLEVFAGRLRNWHQIIGVSFVPAELPLSFEQKPISQAKFTLKFNLSYRSKPLGVLTIHRKVDFAAADKSAIAVTLKAFEGPLYNSIKYASACHSAYHDALTGLYNRAALDKSLMNNATVKDPSKDPLVLLVCDVDRFKSINDTCGHAVGDEVLRQFSSLLNSMTRDSDIVYRYGGDEFVIALVNTTEEGGREFGERIRSAISDCTLEVENAHINLTTTIGMTVLCDDESIDDAFERADQALLSGKKTGRNKVVWR